MSMQSSDYYFKYKGKGRLYVEGSDNSTFGNGVVNKSIERAILPRYFEGKKVYGTGYRSLAFLQNLVFVFIPNTYMVISSDSFQASPMLESVVFEEGSRVESIWFWLLINSKITTFRIPASAKTIRLENSFEGCTNLKTLYYQGMSEMISDSKTFSNVPDDLKIYVRKDYPDSQVGGRDVIKVLPPLNSFIKTCNNKKNSRSYNIMFIAMIMTF